MAHPPVVLLPKNSGLVEQVTRASVLRPDFDLAVRYTVRGEDVPYLSNEFSRRGRRVVAYTGDDLVDEWLAAGNKLDHRLRRAQVAWVDPRARFGRPALCLIGAPGLDITTLHPARVAICARYWNLGRRFIQKIDAAGAIECIKIQGALETVCLQGLADFIIDVVVTGKTAAAAGLVIHNLISTSDVAILEAR